jgi:hypothetical protein
MLVTRKSTVRPAGGVAYLAVAAALLGVPSLASADETFVVKNTVAIPASPGNTAGTLLSFDISWVDPWLHAYFLADRSNTSIDVIDTKSKTVTHQFMPGFRGFTGNNDNSGPNGVLTINNNGRIEVWSGDGPSAACNTNTGVITPSACSGTGGSTVKVINYATGALIANIPTGGLWRADEMCYDPVDHLVQVANDAEADTAPNVPYVSFIKTEGPNAYKVVKQIKFPEATNGIEQCQWSPRTGLIYLNLPEVNGSGGDTTDGNVAVINPQHMDVIDRYKIPVDECAGPQGMAIGPGRQILLGCNAASAPPGSGQNAAIIDELTGKITHLLTGLGGDDEVWFNPGDGHYFLAGGSFLPNEQLGVVDSRGDNPDLTVLIGNAGGTTRRAHSVAADLNLNQAYVPIPATGGGTPGFTSTICGTLAAKGCVAVFGSMGKDDPPVFSSR